MKKEDLEKIEKLENIHARRNSILDDHYRKFLILRGLPCNDDTYAKFERHFESRLDGFKDMLEMISLNKQLMEYVAPNGRLRPDQLKEGGVYTIIKRSGNITFVLNSIKCPGNHESHQLERWYEILMTAGCDRANGDVFYGTKLFTQFKNVFIKEAEQDELDFLLSLMKKDDRTLSVNRDKVIAWTKPPTMNDQPIAGTWREHRPSKEIDNISK